MSQRVANIASAVLVLALVAGGVLAFRQVSRLESRVAELDERVTESDNRAAQAASRALQAEEAARAASLQAQAADQRALEEQRARYLAENARIAAEDDADMARLEADFAEQAAEEARAEAEQLRTERDAEMQRLQDALGNIAETQRTALGLVMNLGADTINFDTDEAELKPADRELLSRIAGVLLTSSGFRVQVFGHTDDVGTPAYNQTLSERRAAAVANYLIDAGLAAEIITTKGFGLSKPLVAGTSDAARARNRRVEVGIIDTLVRYTDEAPRRQQ